MSRSTLGSDIKTRRSQYSNALLCTTELAHHVRITHSFKAFSLRPAFASGVGHHDRAACLWCRVPGTECGVHLLHCYKAPADATAVVHVLLDRILDEMQPRDPASPPPARTRSHKNAALPYISRLDWPKLSKPTLIATLKGLGRLINTYRNTWAGLPGARNPIRSICIPP